MSNVDKSLVAAVLAVRQGVIPADRAADILANAQSPTEALSRVESALDGVEVDEFSGGTVAISPSLVDIVADRLDGDGNLDDLGFDDTTMRTLSEIRRLKADDPGVRDTLLSISPTRMVKDLDLDEMPLIDASEHTETGRPTVRPKDIAKRKPSSQILRAVARAERYSIEREHARGGMGRILVARDHVIGREVALKELLPSRKPGASVPQQTEESRGLSERFLREAKVTGQLEHPNIVSVYEIGKNEDDSLYYTMKFVHGQTLAGRLSEIDKDVSLDKKEKFAARLKLLDNFVDVCNAIAYAHSKGVVHRDLKPENVMLGEYGETIVLDWGLARVKGQEDTVADKLIQTTRYMSNSIVQGETDKLTLDGSIVGTPAYMAPEQARGELDEIDEQSDVYALGAVLYQILCGRPPFDGPVAGLIIQQVLNAQPLRLSAVAPDCPAELEALVERAMAKDKTERLKSAREFASEVKAFRDGRTLQSYSYSARELAWRWFARRKRSVIAGMIVFYVLIAGAVFHYAQLRQEKQQVEQEKIKADTALRQATLASADARAAEKDARKAKDLAEEKQRAAQAETTAKEDALQGWNQTLADAYAMRIRLAFTQKDQNSALAFAAAALHAEEQAEARGAVLSAEACPLIWNLQPDKPSTQELYQFFDVKFSADGRHIATGMVDGNLWLWSTETGKPTQVIKLGNKFVYDVAFSPDGRWLAAGDDDGKVTVLERNPKNGEYQSSGHDFQTTKRERVTSLEFTPDGSAIITGGLSVQMYSMQQRKLLGGFEGPRGSDPMYVSVSPDGRTLLSTSILLDDLFVRVWDIPERKFKRGLLDQTSMHEMFTAWAPDGSLFASSTMEGQIILRDGQSLKRKAILNSHTSSVLGIAFSADSSQMLSCSADGTVRLWDVAEQTERLVLSGFKDWIQSVAFSPDGHSICARDTRGNVLVWALPEVSDRALKGHDGDVMDVDYSPDGKRFVSTAWDGSIGIWDANTHTQLLRLTVPLKQFFSCVFLDDGRVAAGGSDGVFIFNANTGEQLAHVNKGEYVLGLSVAPDGKRFYLAQYRSAHAINSETYEEEFETRRHTQMCLGVAISADGTKVATGSLDSGVIVSDAASGEFQFGLVGNAGTCYAVSFKPDGKFLAAAYDSREVLIWDLGQKKVVRRLQHEGIVFGVLFSPDGKLMFSSSQDRMVRVWDTSDWHCIAVLKGHTETVSRMTVSLDGQTLISGSQDDTIRIWALADMHMPRPDCEALAFVKSGLRVEDKEFAVRMDSTWPAGVEHHRELMALRTRNSTRLNRFTEEFTARFEGYRFQDTVNAQGARVRRYFAPRAVDDNGRRVGPAQGQVNYAAWWADQNPQWAPGIQHAPAVTEVFVTGQGSDLGLKVGDLLWSVDGKRVETTDDLKAILPELEGRENYPVVIRRFALDANGVHLTRRDAEGALLLDANGRTTWEMSEFTVDFKPDKLGMRIGDGRMLERPLR